MKKCIFLCLVVLVAVAIGHASGEMASVESKSQGFKIQVPSSWKVNAESSSENNQLALDVPAAGDEYIICYFAPLKGNYAAAKKNLPASFRSENFASFDEMYGAEKLKIKVIRKASCTKVNSIEVCSGEFKYDYQQNPNQHTYYAIFRTDKGAQQAFFSTGPSIYMRSVDVFKKKVIASLTLIR